MVEWKDTSVLGHAYSEKKFWGGRSGDGGGDRGKAGRGVIRLGGESDCGARTVGGTARQEAGEVFRPLVAGRQVAGGGGVLRVGEGEGVATDRTGDQTAARDVRVGAEEVLHAVGVPIVVGVVAEVTIGWSKPEGGIGDPNGEGVGIGGGVVSSFGISFGMF